MSTRQSMWRRAGCKVAPALCVGAACLAGSNPQPYARFLRGWWLSIRKAFLARAIHEWSIKKEMPSHLNPELIFVVAVRVSPCPFGLPKPGAVNKFPVYPFFVLHWVVPHSFVRFIFVWKIPSCANHALWRENRSSTKSVVNWNMLWTSLSHLEPNVAPNVGAQIYREWNPNRIRNEINPKVDEGGIFLEAFFLQAPNPASIFLY